MYNEEKRKIAVAKVRKYWGFGKYLGIWFFWSLSVTFCATDFFEVSGLFFSLIPLNKRPALGSLKKSNSQRWIMNKFYRITV